MGMLVWGCAISMVRATGGAQSPAGGLLLSIILFLTCLSLGGQVQTTRLRMNGGIIARPASTAPGSSFYTARGWSGAFWPECTSGAAMYINLEALNEK